MQQRPQPQLQRLPQRVNFCTICNKELCNKYFMKTHMLKMHGINLKLDDNVAKTSGVEPSPEVEEAQSLVPAGGDRDRYHKRQSTSTLCKRKFKTNGTISVKNGFAGNSMGGVVCDICNKELCSKYFLKVHKQNTHGIATDYQDLSRQLLLPLYAAQQQQQNLVMHSAMTSTSLLQQNHQQHLGHRMSAGYGFTPTPNPSVPPGHVVSPGNNKSTSIGDNSNTRLNAYYTEACPMCDRKFKSIKWLKTHMLNNHKEEIQLFLANLVATTSATKQNDCRPMLIAHGNQHQRLY